MKLFPDLGWILLSAPPPMERFDPLMTAPPTITGFITVDSLLAGDLGAFSIALQYLALSVLTLAYVVSGAIIRMVRTNTLRAVQSDYMLYARASGLPERMVARYALCAALTPAVTLVGIFYGVLLWSAVIVEVVFSLSGIGQYAVRSVLAFDYPAARKTRVAELLTLVGLLPELRDLRPAQLRRRPTISESTDALFLGHGGAKPITREGCVASNAKARTAEKQQPLTFFLYQSKSKEWKPSRCRIRSSILRPMDQRIAKHVS